MIRLPSQLFAPEIRISLAASIGGDLNCFLDGLAADRLIDPKSLRLNNTVAEIVRCIAQATDKRYSVKYTAAIMPILFRVLLPWEGCKEYGE